MTFQTLITPTELAQYLDQPQWVIVDCRFELNDVEAGRRAYQQSHIAGAVYAHLDKDLSGPPLTDRGRHPLPAPEALMDLFSRLGIHAGTQVVAYDDSTGAIAGRLWWMLRYMGHDAVAVIDGGWAAWLEANLPVRSGVEENARTSFQGTPRRRMLVTIDELPSGLLVDSRDPVRFRGEQEPLDPRAGHIPGAVNYPYASNLDATGRFLTPQQLKEQLLATHANAPPENVVYYCGSGVSACHNVLAHVHAGLPEGRLYVGSWSEWCSDPRRPIATSGLSDSAAA